MNRLPLILLLAAFAARAQDPAPPGEAVPVTPPGAAAPAPVKAEPPALRMIADLADGSRLVGVPGFASFSLDSSIGRIEIPVDQVAGITLGTNASAVVSLVNSDRLSGLFGLPQLPLETLFGPVRIDAATIRKIAFSRSPAVVQGLLLWNRLESEADVRESRVGPGGDFRTGRFVEGRFGKGLLLNPSEIFGATFPGEVVKSAAGCIEFWARITDFSNMLTDGAQPALFAAGRPYDDLRMMIHLNANDGAAMGGLCIRYGLSAGTGAYGSWTYSRALDTDAPEDWHHYALTWDWRGIKGVENGSRTVAAYVDGKLNTHAWQPAPAHAPEFPRESRLGLMYHEGLKSLRGGVVYDNLKVWDYAKTDFSDRLEE